MSKVWLITGCSTGFGRELATNALEAGHKVVVTARNPKDIEDIVSKFTDTSIAVQLDVTKPEEIKSSVKQAMEKF